MYRNDRLSIPVFVHLLFVGAHPLFPDSLCIWQKESLDIRKSDSQRSLQSNNGRPRNTRRR